MLLVSLILVACGIFMLVYGGLLFRFTLAAAAFVLGYLIATSLATNQPQSFQILVGLVTGGALAIVVYSLVRAVLHIAGGLLGAVLVILVLSLLPFKMGAFLNLVAIIAGAGAVGFFGNRLGDWVIILATTLTGAYAATYGLIGLFPEAYPDTFSGGTLIRFTGPALAVFVVLFLVGALAQAQLRSIRGRFVNL